MADYLSAELAATCAALGYYDGQKYHLDNHCLDVIKDLIRYLKKDDDNHTIRCFLGQTKLLQTDLIKIFVEYLDQVTLWDVLLRLIINLTSPALLIYNGNIPKEQNKHNTYLQIVSHLQSYKVALTDDNVWVTVSKRLGEILSINSSERGEENEMLLDRILAFIKNVLQVPPDDNENRVDNDATIHDQILFAFHTSGMVDLLLYIASNNDEQQYHMQILEIISFMLLEQNASQLATCELQRSRIEKEKDQAFLLAARNKERMEKMEKIKKYAGSRHSRFGSTYVVQNMKAIGDNQLICHKPFQNIESFDFNQQKEKIRKSKNKRPLVESTDNRVSALSVRLFLKEFCVEFLNGAYNPVMRHAKSCLMSDVHEETSDAICYLWTLRFFMEFNRHYKFEVKYVSETISTSTFYSVQRQIEKYYEMTTVDKAKVSSWSRKMHTALRAYQELLYTLMAMDKSADLSVRESSKIIKSNIFYVPEYRDTLLSQLLNFNETKMSRQYLIDLLTTTHVFMKMIEYFSAKGQRSLVVQTVKKKRQKGKKKRLKSQKEKAPAPSLEIRWNDLAPELSAVMQGGTIREMIPFDATLDIPIDEQKKDAMKRIQKLLRSKYFEEALGLLRSSREVWPENDCFGRVDIPPEEEFLALREIFFADLGVIEEEPAEDETNKEDRIDEHEEEDEDEDEEEEEESEAASVVETNFNFNEFIERFANVKIVKVLSTLLRQFEINTCEVNHYVVKMLHRIAWDCKIPAMFFQASIFRTFQRILESKKPEHKELQKFAMFIMRRFIEVAGNNRKVYMELLFWKSYRDAREVVDGYDTMADKKKGSRAVWTEEEEDELRTLFMEHQTNRYPEDLIGWILKHLINDTRTRRGVIKKLKEMCLIVNSKGVRSEVQKRLPAEWSEEEIAQLTELWEQFMADEDPVELIYNGLMIKRSKPKIKDKLLELGLAKDRKELHKKRSRKSNPGKSSWETQSVGNSDGDQDSSDEEETAKSSRRRNAAAPSKPTKRRAQKGSRKRRPTLMYTDAQLSGLLKDVIDRNMTAALEWIKESLEDVLEDRDEESVDGIPLVPLTDYSLAAMDSSSFQKLLNAIGIQPPVDEQEVYWRIPASMLSSTIRNRSTLIGDVLDGKFVPEEPQKSSRYEDIDRDVGDDDDSDDDIDVLESVKKFFAPKEPEASTSREVGETSNVFGTKESAKSKKAKNASKITEATEEPVEVKRDADVVGTRKKIAMRTKAFDDSSDSDIETNIEEKQDVGVVGTRKKIAIRTKAFDDSSDSDIEGKQNDDKRSRSESPDVEVPSGKKRRLLDSDNEDELPTTTNSKSRKLLVASDDEENPLLPLESNGTKSTAVLGIDDESSSEGKPKRLVENKPARMIISDDDTD